jgi:DAACS family dicarboxylate/amino acid:cation (Na+ or H+) symporter
MLRRERSTRRGEAMAVGPESGPAPASDARRARRILAALVLGAAAGALARAVASGSPLLDRFVDWVAYPLGQLFLRLLFLAVLPLVTSSLALGVCELGDVRRLGRVGAKTFAFTVGVSAVSVAIGIALVNLFEPGRALSEEERSALLTTLTGQAGRVVEQAQRAISPVDALLQIVPRNPFEALVRAFDGEMLGVFCFALLVGVALATTPRERTSGLVATLEGVYTVSLRLIQIAMALAPIGVFALLFTLTARLGVDLLATLGRFVAVVLAGLALQQFGVYALLVRGLAGLSPRLFYGRMTEVMTTAFSTSSSAATLPTALRVSQERLGVPREIASFVLTLGSTANQNGTALFEGVTVLFLAQLVGIELGLAQQASVVLLSILGGVGTAGVPGGSLPMIVVVLQSVGVPPEAIGVVLGVDRLLDMSRTVLNVTGDVTAAVWVAKSEGQLVVPPEPG